MHPRGIPIGGQVARMTDPADSSDPWGQGCQRPRFSHAQEISRAKISPGAAPLCDNSDKRTSQFCILRFCSVEPRPSVSVVAPLHDWSWRAGEGLATAHLEKLHPHHHAGHVLGSLAGAKSLALGRRDPRLTQGSPVAVRCFPPALS
jgi:hypothetical protein